jgi:hypothetical protein
MAAVVRAAREANAAFIWSDYANLRPGTREHFLAHLAQDWPEELARYRRLYGEQAYLPEADRKALRQRLDDLKREIPAVTPAPSLIAPEPEPVQLAFAI